jgi:hypothetical protein
MGWCLRYRHDDASIPQHRASSNRRSKAFGVPNATSKAPYPPPPWHLQGWAIQTFTTIPLSVARRYVPPELPIVQVWPGYTLGTVAFASYERGTLAYNELLLAIGLVWLRGLRFCIPRLWVDSEASVAGGREMWKLPKQLAIIKVLRGDEVITIDAGDICRIEACTNRYNIPLWLPVLAFGQSADSFFPFTAFVRASASLAHVEISRLNDELASLQLGRPLLSIHYPSLDMLVHAPA